VLVGDRGMLTQTQIDVLKKHPGLGWMYPFTGRTFCTVIS